MQLSKVNVRETAGKGSVKQGIADNCAESRKALVDAIGASGRPRALVTDLRSWSNPDYTRIAVTLDREVTFTPHKLRRDPQVSLPERIYIDFAGARIAPGVKDISIGDGLLKTARVGQFRSDVVRVVLDIENIQDYKIFPLSDPFRVIIDVKGERRTEISRLENTIQASRPEPVPEREPVRVERVSTGSSFKPAKIRRIVVDPGHGGHDPGAIGADGLKEKDIVLSIGLKLARQLKEQLGLDVVMTRSTDVFIPLEERTAIANKVNADLFLSIHANASLNRSASGIETYYLNLAKSDKAVRVAARENNTSLEKVGLLQNILFDLMANYKINDSARLADDVQKSLHGKLEKKYSGVKNLGVKQGPFYVLLGATMPSILVETAFISNEHDAELLADSNYHEATAAGIVEGVRSYIKQLH
ncbi:MAG: N-acetylmuramoyl-L-alanine amidase [Deltaproteobacteria bacterium]|nr:N-acetylmuramoyl-L-alanine amidase [Deltaproteobacteria bacterium]TLN04847.1 MAG: N-acetylmuramoyl-L-alanine amidase [bacterium]